ncbi:MAG: CBS domain-containing protein [Bacillota bacterium]
MNLIVTHENGDFDALASVVAASKLYPGSFALLPEPLQSNVRSFVNLYRDLLPLIDPKEINEVIELVIVVDTNQKERLGKWTYLTEQARQVIVYDHHPGEENFKAVQSKIENVGSTTTLLLEEMSRYKTRLSEFEATLFALGIYEDTGCLTYNITTRRDARVLASLWGIGVNLKVIQEYLRAPLSDLQKNLLERLIHNSEHYQLNQRRVLLSTTVLDEYVFGASVIIQLLDDIEDAGLTIIIVQMDENVYLAARARDSDLDLLELLSPFEVKGYPEAVSAHYKNARAGETKEKVIEFLKKYLPPVVTAEKAATKKVFSIDIDTSVKEADEKLFENNFKGCPVIEKGSIAGMISRRDLRKGLRSNLGHAPVKGFMSREVVTASPGYSLLELRRLMIKHNIGRIPIIDAQGNISGIVTRSDILRYLSFLDRKGHSLKNPSNPSPVGKTQSNDDKLIFEENGSINLLPLINNELPKSMAKLLLQISHLAGRENKDVYLVGGIIRDLLLGYPPEKDLDFVTLDNAVDFSFELQKLIGGEIKYHDHFGTASISLEGYLRLDFVTARKEYYAAPAALPQVESSSLKNDLFRRDFTINTMACSLRGENYGELYDYYNGRTDLKNKVIRVLYKLSFVDDPLRILRAVRFEQRYDFSIEPETLKLIKNAVERRVLEKVSRHRLNQELRLIYKEPAPVNILKRFAELNIFPFLFPRIRPEQSTWQLLVNIEESLKLMEQDSWRKKPDKELVYLSGLLLGLDSVERSAIIRKLNLSRERASKVITACKEIPAVVSQLNQAALSPSTVVNCLETLPVEAIIMAYALAESKTVREHLKLYMGALQHMQPSLGGRDLKKLGLEPGPRYRKIIDSLKQAVVDGEVRTPQEELDYVINYLERERGREEY